MEGRLECGKERFGWSRGREREWGREIVCGTARFVWWEGESE